MTGNAALLLRVGFSFSLVLGLMWIAARVMRTRTSGRPTDAVEVLARTQLGRGSSVAVLRIGDRALVLGVTERTITQLGEPLTDLAALRGRGVTTVSVDDVIFNEEHVSLDDDMSPEPVRKVPTTRAHARTRSAVPPASDATAGEGALAGSILSPATWRLGMDALRERTVRRG